MRKVVVLPHPEGPSRLKNFPSGRVKLTLSTARKSPKLFVTAWVSRVMVDEGNRLISRRETSLCCWSRRLFCDGGLRLLPDLDGALVEIGTQIVLELDLRDVGDKRVEIHSLARVGIDQFERLAIGRGIAQLLRQPRL